MKKNFINGIVYLSIMSIFTYCAVNPVSGKKQIVLMSEEQELQMGKDADPQIVQEFGLYPDSNLQRFINQKGQTIAKLSHRPNIPYHFKVLDSDVINAFALPGGYVYFTRGIMAYMNNEAQFEGVLGHEIGHITARHTVSQQATQTLTQLGLIAAVIYDKRIAQFAETASQGLQLMYLSFSRDAERQSDELGVQYSSKAGYDAHEMAKFFKTLERETKQSNSVLPEFLSTHPDPGQRFTTINKLATDYQAANKLTNLKINRNNYLQLVEGIVYGPDPRQGFLENGVFYHPEMRFQFNTPIDWQYKNAPSQVLFAPKDGTAMLFLTLASGNSPEQAAQTFIQKSQLKISESKGLQVNGLPAFYLIGDQVQSQDQSGKQLTAVRALVYFIQYNGQVYELAGVSTPEKFGNLLASFHSYMGSFKQLTDAAKLNIKPERLRLRSLASNTTLQQALGSYGVPSSRHEEMAILNGMQLTDQLTKGTVIKIVERN